MSTIVRCCGLPRPPPPPPASAGATAGATAPPPSATGAAPAPGCAPSAAASPSSGTLGSRGSASPAPCSRPSRSRGRGLVVLPDYLAVLGVNEGVAPVRDVLECASEVTLLAVMRPERAFLLKQYWHVTCSSSRLRPASNVSKAIQSKCTCTRCHNPRNRAQRCCRSCGSPCPGVQRGGGRDSVLAAKRLQLLVGLSSHDPLQVTHAHVGVVGLVPRVVGSWPRFDRLPVRGRRRRHRRGLLWG